MTLLAELDLLDDLPDITSFAIKTLEKGQGFVYGELFGQLRVLKLDAQQLAEIVGIRFPAPAEHFNAAGIGGEEPFADLDRGRFSGTVGAEEAEAFAGLDLKVEAIDGDDIVICLTETLDSECGG
jgi:hypothetical protein